MLLTRDVAGKYRIFTSHVSGIRGKTCKSPSVTFVVLVAYLQISISHICGTHSKTYKSPPVTSAGLVAKNLQFSIGHIYGKTYKSPSVDLCNIVKHTNRRLVTFVIPAEKLIN